MRASPKDADEATLNFVSELLVNLGIRPGLRNYDVAEQHIELMAPQAFADACHQTNPVPVTESDLRQLYYEAL